MSCCCICATEVAALAVNANSLLTSKRQQQLQWQCCAQQWQQKTVKHSSVHLKISSDSVATGSGGLVTALLCYANLCSVLLLMIAGAQAAVQQQIEQRSMQHTTAT
jgi:hypothetical protein